MENRISDLEKQVADGATTANQVCCICKEYSFTDLQLENGEYICESCAQIMGELASF